ncbi:MAG TPA: hypothetical protein VGE07_09915, partial [Herpetosiphonaceae bacterium]
MAGPTRSRREDAMDRTAAPDRQPPPPADPPGPGWVTCRREWRVRSAPAALWSFISDTHRLNYETGNPRLRLAHG